MAHLNVPTDWLYFLPIGLLGIVRWLVWIIRRVPAAMYRPVVNDFRLPISVVVPVYQEDPDIFGKAIESWLDNRVAEVILVIDSSDQVCQAIAARYPVTVVITDVPGKRDALRRGWEAASTPLVALVDSDVIWATDVADQVCMPFADPRVGGVSTRQNVYNPRGFLQRVNDMFLDYRYFDENAAQTAAGRAVSCISGRTAVYRRPILLAISDDFMAETFLGVPCMSGDDKCLTALTMKAGYATVLQRTARVWSTFPDTFRIFAKQRLRWARNTWRSDIRALVLERWAWKHPFLAFTMLDKAVSSFTLLAAPVFMALAIARHAWAFVALLAGWWWLSRSIKLLPHLRRRPSSFLLVPPFVLLTFWMAVVKLWALLTVRKQRWLTRQVAVIDGEVVRTGTGPAEPAPVPGAASVSRAVPDQRTAQLPRVVPDQRTAQLPRVAPDQRTAQLPRVAPDPTTAQIPRVAPSWGAATASGTASVPSAVPDPATAQIPRAAPVSGTARVARGSTPVTTARHRRETRSTPPRGDDRR